MVLLEPQEARFKGIEERLVRIEERMATKIDIASMQADLAEIKGRLAEMPSRWMVWVFMLTTIIPLYGILVTLLLMARR